VSIYYTTIVHCFTSIYHFRPEYNPNTELCTVYYAPLNFRDIMLASGKLPPDALPGDLAGQVCLLFLNNLYSVNKICYFYAI